MNITPLDEMMMQIAPWIRALIGLSMSLPLAVGVWLTRHDVS